MDAKQKTSPPATPTSGASSVANRRAARAEVVWEGKYDATGRRVAPLRVALPFQTVETVNESAQDRQRNLFTPGFRQEEWRNRLIWGDKKYVLPSLLGEFAGKVNLIYIDPPFDTGADFSFTATVPDAPNEEEGESLTFSKEPSLIEQKAYRDTWGRGLESYLQWFYETAGLLHELLSEEGSIYVHLDWHVSFYCKAILDEVFGADRFLLVPPDRRDEVAASPKLVPGEIARLALDVLRDPDRTLSFHEADHLRHGIFRRNGNQHVDVIGHQMAFFDLAFAPPRQFMEHVAQTLLDHAENRFLAVFRDENHMIFALPCGMVLVMLLRH